MENQHMGAAILRLRKEKGMTQQELADKLQVTAQAVSKWERGVSCPDLSILPQVAETLGVDVDELFSNHLQPANRHPFRELGREDIKEMFFLLGALRKPGAGSWRFGNPFNGKNRCGGFGNLALHCCCVPQY